MTISTEVRKAGPFIGNGSASSFPFAFKVFKAADLIVVRRQDNIGVETTLVLDSDYHVTLNVNQDTTPGGVVALTGGALADGFTLIVSSELPYLQTSDLTNQGGFYPKVITNSLDRLTIFCQQLAENLGRTLQLPITAPTNISTEIPLPNPSELLAWNETGTGLTTVSPQSLVTSIAYGSATADLFAGDGVTTTFPLTTNPASVNNLDVSIGGYSQRPVQDGVGDYSWNGGASITFVTPPPAPSSLGDKNVLVRYMQAIPVSDSEALHAQTREALRRSYAEAGYNLVDGSFETGGTLASTTDVLLLEAAGAAYAWTGALPKTVAPGFDPVGVVGFESRTNVLLSNELAGADGAKLVGACPDIAALRTIEPEADRQSISVIGYYTDTPLVGGGTFRYIASDSSSADNGGSVIVTAGGKRWHRVTVGFFEGYSPKQFGCRGGSASGDTAKLQACISTGRVILDDVYKIESTITMPGGLHMVGVGHPVNCGFTGNLGTDKALSVNGSLQVGYLANFGMTGMTSGGLISMSNGAHMWRLDRILFRGCVGPHIIYDNVWDTEFYNIHAIGGGSASGNAVDQAVIVSKGGSNNNIIYGLRIEQPKNCGIHVAANTDLRVVGGKIDCGFTGNQPVNGGCEVYGTLRLHDFLLAGFSVNKVKVYDQGSVLADNVIFGGGGGAPHIYWRPTYARVGSTAQSFRPKTGVINIIGGILEKVHSDVTTVVPYAVDAAIDISTYVRRSFAVAAVSSATSFFAPAGTYTANDTDDKYYAMKRDNPRLAISRIGTSFSTQQIDTLEPHGLTTGDNVSIVSAANEYLPLFVSNGTELQCNIGRYTTVQSIATPFVSGQKTLIYSNYDFAVLGSALGKWVVTSDGDAYLIVEATGGNLSVFGSVASEFGSGTSFVVSSAEYLDVSKVGGRYKFYADGAEKAVLARIMSTKGRNSALEIFPFKD